MCTFGGILRQDAERTWLYLESWPSLDIWTSYADGEGSRDIEIRDPYDEMSLDAGTKSYVPDKDWYRPFDDDHWKDADEPMKFSECCGASHVDASSSGNRSRKSYGSEQSSSDDDARAPDP